MPANLRIAEPENATMSRDRSCAPFVPGQLARETAQIVESIHQSFLRAVEPGISDLLHVPSLLRFRDSAQASFSSALDTAESGDRSIAFDLSPVRGCAFLIFTPALLFRVLDILLGTPDETQDNSSRQVTDIELHILREFFDIFSCALREAWEPFCPVAFHQIAQTPELVQSCKDDSALILRASLTIAGVTAEMRLAIPAFLARLAELKSRTLAGRDTGPRPLRDNILKSLAGATVQMEAVLNGASIRISDLLDLTPGQILMVGSSEGAPFDCLVNGKRKFTGSVVASNGRCGLQIDSLVGPAAN